MAIRPSVFFRLLLAADGAAIRHGDARLARETEEAWADVAGRRGEAARCKRGVEAAGSRARCILPHWHDGPCETWLSVRWERGSLVEIRESNDE